MAAADRAGSPGDRDTWQRTPPKRRVSIATLFSAGLALAIFLSVGSVLAINVVSSRLSVLQLLGQRFDATIATLSERLEAHLAPPEHQLEYVAEWVAREPGLADDTERLKTILRAAMAATPQVIGVALMRPDQSSVRLQRGDPKAWFDDLGERYIVAPVLEEARRRGPDGPRLGWSDPLFSSAIGRPIIVYRQTLWRDGLFMGVLFSAVSIDELSRFSRELSLELGQTVFILLDRLHVIAHPNLIDLPRPAGGRALHVISEVGDERLSVMWREGRYESVARDYMQKSRGHWFRHNGEVYVYTYAELNHFGSKPWLIGWHYAPDPNSEIRQFWRTAIIGLVMLALFVALAFFVGRRLAYPIRRLAKGAREVGALDFSAVRPMPPSAVREFEDAARSFNAMVDGLRWFETYVPKRLVHRILQQGGPVTDLSEERQVTVMFTDVVGFSSLAEGLPPRDTAAMLNEHFCLIGACIEASGGTIDKYTGDGVMAFWGAPERQDDHARRACRTAAGIATAVRTANRQRVARGLPPVQVRVGLHTGPAVVGNVGAEGRINYTIIGDTVNVASRIQGIGRELPVTDAVLLVSGDTIAAAGADLRTELVGHRQLKGRHSPVEIHRVVGG